MGAKRKSTLVVSDDQGDTFSIEEFLHDAEETEEDKTVVLKVAMDTSEVVFLTGDDIEALIEFLQDFVDG